MASVSVDVDVDADEFDDHELVAELISRGYAIKIPEDRFEKLTKWRADRLRDLKCEVAAEIPPEDELEAIKEAILDRRAGDAIAIIDAMIAPKFRSVDACLKKYSELMNQKAAQ